MEDWVNGWTLGGVLTTIAGALTVLWRRSAQAGGARRLAQWASAIGRLQIAEGEIDYIKEALRYCREETDYWVEEARTKDVEIQSLRAQLRRPQSSPSETSSVESSDGSTGKPGARTRRRRPT